MGLTEKGKPPTGLAILCVGGWVENYIRVRVFHERFNQKG
jgi:hypothetical protein